MANLSKARSKNTGADKRALDSYAATRQRVEQILQNHNLFLTWERRKAIIANIRDGDTSFDWLRDRSDLWWSNHQARTLEFNRDTPFDNDLSAIRNGYQGVYNRLLRIYQTRDLDVDPQRIGAEAQRVLNNKVTIDSIRKKANNLRAEYDSAGAVQDAADAVEDADTPDFDLNTIVRGMFPFLTEELVSAYTAGWEESGDPAVALQKMRESPAYERAFPGNQLEPGVFAMSEADYVSYRQQARDLMREYGLPAEYFDQDADIGKLVSGQVRLSQLEERIRKGYVAALNAPSEVREEMQRNFGFGIGDLAAFWLDPSKGEDLLTRKFTEAQIRAASTTSGFGQLTIEDSEELASFGVTEAQAREGFAALVEGRGLFEGMIGSREEDVSLQEQIGATFLGDAEARDRIRRRAQNRIAAFQGAGGSATTETGSLGLRSADN